MNYKLSITKQEINENYQDQIRGREPWIPSAGINEPQQFYDVECLSMKVTQEQFDAIRKACLEVMK